MVICEIVRSHLRDCGARIPDAGAGAALPQLADQRFHYLVERHVRRRHQHRG